RMVDQAGAAMAGSRSADAEARALVGRRTRQKIADFVDENIEKVIERLWSLTYATKTAWATCSTCQRRVEVEVPDTHGAVKALEALVNQGYGRPQQEQANGGGGLVVRRVIVMPGEALPGVGGEAA